jgi:hypothetical protein
VKIAHFVGMDSDELEGPVNEFLAVNGEEIEYSVLIVYREDSV